MPDLNIPTEKILEELANRLFRGAPDEPSPQKGPEENVHAPFKDPFLSAAAPTPPYTASPDEGALNWHQSIVLPENDPFSAKSVLPYVSFFDSPIPASVPGNGASPGINNSFANNGSSPGNNDRVSPFDLEPVPKPESVSSVLPSRDTFRHDGRLPFSLGEPAYYFEKTPAFSDAVKTGYPGIEYPGSPQAVVSRFDVEAVRRDFPILSEYVNGKRLVWFDNAATTQKPQAVIDRLSHFYAYENSNIHRAAHALAARATDAYEDARKTVQEFLNARSVNEIIFTRGTTESINLVAATWGEQFLDKDDEIIISHLEHHANIVPWQLLSKKKGFKIHVIPVNDDGELLLDEYAKLLSPKTRLVTFTQVSNALGTVTPAKRIIELAHAAGAKVLLDGAQSVSHFKVDLQHLNPDFFVLSGHKIFGPTGIGVLYGKEELLNTLPPYQGGGNMIQDVTFERTLFHPAPNRFEAGTGNIADAVGLGAALQYVRKIGIENIGRYEHELLEYATYQFKQIPGVKLIGTAKDKASVLSFTLKGYSNEEVGKVLNEYGIAVRTGHHCAQPILRRLGHETSVRPSFAFYNTRSEVDRLAQIIYRLSGQRR